jgi:hypothetical protein
VHGRAISNARRWCAKRVRLLRRNADAHGRGSILRVARRCLGAGTRVISESLAEKLFAFEQPVGRQIWLAARAQTAEIIGVVGEVKHRALDETSLPTVYLSALQAPSRSSIIVVRRAHPDADVIRGVREEVARLDGNIPVYRVRSMQEVLAASPGVPARRVLTATFTGFALLALVLGAIGLFGVVAHDVAARRAEIALRIALGADPMRILQATLGQGADGGSRSGGRRSAVDLAARVLSGVGFVTDRFDVLGVTVPAAMLIITRAAATCLRRDARRASTH